MQIGILNLPKILLHLVTHCVTHTINPQIKTIFFLLKCTDENLNLMLCKCQTKTNAIEITEFNNRIDCVASEWS